MKSKYRAWSALLSLVCVIGLAPSCAGTVRTSGAGGGSSAGSGGASAGAAGAPPSEVSCVESIDCTWGEIDREILKASDCPCLYGCPYLAQNVVTARRRIEQYKALCKPSVDGHGQGCGIDDCATPGPITCIDRVCAAAPLRR